MTIYQNEKQQSNDVNSKEQKEKLIRHDRDPLRGLFPGLALILAGILLFASFQGWLGWGVWWQYLLVGLGSIFLIEAFVRYAVSRQREHVSGRLIPGIILLFVGLAFIFGWDRWWPLALVAGGLIIILNVLLKNK